MIRLGAEALTSNPLAGDAIPGSLRFNNSDDGSANSVQNGQPTSNPKASSPQGSCATIDNPRGVATVTLDRAANTLPVPLTDDGGTESVNVTTGPP